MAGGFNIKSNSKSKFPKQNSFGNEVVKESKTPPKFRLSGILGMGQSVDINKQKQPEKPQINWEKEFFGHISHLQREEQTLFNSHQKEVQKAIEEIRDEIKKLVSSSQDLSEEIENIALEPIVEFNAYQLNFLQRIKNIIITFRKNISEASCWLDSFKHKQKRKAFWNNVKNKKGGGEQYLFSGEHSAARSAN